MTPQEARYILYQTAKKLKAIGYNKEDFLSTVNKSPYLLGDDFENALELEGDKIKHVVELVWKKWAH